MTGVLSSFQEAIGWLHVLVALAAVVVCAVNLQRSRWVLVLLAGFGIEAAVSLVYRAMSLLMARGTLVYANVTAIFLLISFVGIVGSATIVGGLAGLLADRGGAKRLVRDPDPADRA
jgi:hypothetical protein